MIFANTDFAYTVHSMVCDAQETDRGYSSGIYHTNVSECAEKLEGLFDPCSFSAQTVHVRNDSAGAYKTANYR